jgi:formate dehydrogenase major subunit
MSTVMNLQPTAIPTIELELDGRPVKAFEGESLLALAKRNGQFIPHLCYKDGMRPDGNCRACVVEIKGERTLAPSCCRTATAGMVVSSTSERAQKSQKMVLEMLLSDMPEQGFKWADEIGQLPHGELSEWAAKMDVTVRPELRDIARPATTWADSTHPAMLVNLDACIQCTRCVRACREEQVNGVIGVVARSSHSKIGFDQDDPMGQSSCVACGECVQACPTGALMPKTLVGSQKVDKKIDSVCPFCGVGCLLTYKVKDEKIVAVEGRDGPANHSRLCVKGRFGMDYIHHPHRLTVPLIRKPGIPKDAALFDKAGNWQDVFREATWEEAMTAAADGLKNLRDTKGRYALVGFGSAKGSNEEAYLFQKLVRTGFGSNNVDHCTRLCHASSVAALLEGVGSGAVSNQVNDVAHSGLIFVIGSNPTVNHPVAATWMKNAAKQGVKIVLADPRRTELSQHAWRTLQFRPDTDVAMLNALIYTVIEEGLVDQAFIDARTNNFEALKDQVKNFSPEAMEAVCGIPAATLREVARMFANPGVGPDGKILGSMILWGMGVSQHVHGTDNARCLIALSSVTGQIGKPGSGLHPLRGQNNVQGASDAGLIPMMFPNYQRVDNPGAHAWFENFWGQSLDDKPGLTVVEVMNKALAPDDDPRKVWGMYVMGENPAMSDPDLNHARHALAELKHLVVQDIFMTETAYLADVVLPASAWPEKYGTVTNTDRMIQMGRAAVQPPGQARQDLDLLQELARRMGLNWHYAGPNHGVAAVYEEMRQAMHGVIKGISWERLDKAGSITFPCMSDEDPGQPTVFIDKFATADGRVKLVPTSLITANELPDQEYPMVLITGRQLEHWHTGSMTRRASVLDAIEPVATVSMNGADLDRLGIAAGDLVTVHSRRGTVTLMARRDDGTAKGAIFIPFAYHEAAANLMTNATLDPFGKIPEFKYCAVKVEKGGLAAPVVGYGTAVPA